MKELLEGNLTKKWQDKRDRYVASAVGNGNRHIAAEAKGALVTDIDGNAFIDFAGAIGVQNVGHCHPKVIKAVKEQLEHFIHPGFNVMMYPGYIELCKRLCEIVPGEFAKKAILLNSGAEAVENAVKIARAYTGRQAVVTFDRAFHGRTNLTMSMTSKVKPYKFGFGPFAPETYKAPYPYDYRKPEGISSEDYDETMIEQFNDFFLSQVSPELVACIVMEPVQGEGGFIIPSKRFVKYVRDFCTEHGIVFIADEIQAGFARTGKMFSIEHFDVVPDLMTISKSIAAGFPLSGVVGKAEMIDSCGLKGSLGGTYCGSPIACAAALAVLDIIEEEHLIERAEKIGAIIEARAEEWADTYHSIGDIRRLGAMVAIEFVKDKQSKEPDKELVKRLVTYCNQHGLLLLDAGLKGNCIRFLSPLTITEVQLNQGLAIIEDALNSI
ncbi:4-aminobutyrate--2-oxoglutarate transaminase [Sporolactobacillus terrae]|uniref:(S)-3-amino-2-methylpropionate transaminase n=1 Tax=Sporolactobacillus terrae TaxID=269673 RepID=A0ABX5QBD8_9BACL|nr:4-aminobutyrate--2-oxoglutarate transaminase [Sporolactobacillus terrae]QAA23972.1 4-aminobutyrate--2-oxoglutarate transaminase [Sporolactobacillus terrae]QAA26939.1 4-aminobutyrate--2-oxoglutarate transaminase [Sporolactobacillus terrae]UAK17848.1 4-aminobutyrate--2-oxoglutarate transaminase [Sporolactobacillus terrae]